MDLDKLEILADAAEYDASSPSRCARGRDSCGKAEGGKEMTPLMITADYSPAQSAASPETLRRALATAPQQMNPWPEQQAA
jgi:predicted DNA-binding helix-hairpin-helix protein